MKEDKKQFDRLKFPSVFIRETLSELILDSVVVLIQKRRYIVVAAVVDAIRSF